LLGHTNREGGRQEVMTVQDGDPNTVVQPGEGTIPVPVSLNFINNEFTEPSTGEFMDVECPGISLSDEWLSPRAVLSFASEACVYCCGR
jgi:hypothetical protein